MEKETDARAPEEEQAPEAARGAAGTVTRIARVGARYGFGFVFRRRLVPSREADLTRVGVRLRRSFEDLGPTFVELGRYLASRGDLVPPDVAAELGRKRLPVSPMPFEEVRDALERELHSDLFRLYVSFEPTPQRVGPLTQAHRAVLPGDRPALVVVRRAGVRRDLLAMRPVADLTRRRLGERLPLDPSEVVSDFVAHSNHRRDMYFASQTLNRLKNLDEPPGFGLPSVYRSHSASRCITFGGVPEGRPARGEELLRAAGGAVRLALTGGVFFADLVPERFEVDAEGGLWLADPTEVFSLDPERMRGLAEVFAAARREDVDALRRSLPLAGTHVPADDLALRRELREALGSLGGPLWSEHTLTAMRRTVLEALRRGGARLQPEVALMLASLVAAERLPEPDADLAHPQPGRERPVTVAAVRAAGDHVDRHRDPVNVAGRFAQKVARPDLYAEYPRQIHSVLTELQDGEIEVRFRHGGLDQLISKVDILANRLVFAFLIAALIIGSSMLGTFVETGIQVLGVSIFGFVGFVVAAVMGVMLLFGIVRSGRI